ncbi:MAG: MGMT family protein, partial [Pseudomonadota bacterium]
MPMIAVETQFGRLGVEETDGAITRLIWNGRDEDAQTPLLQEAAAQVTAYDQGRLDRFDLPYRVTVSDFQRQVCDLMFAIPLGETRTYGDIAKDLDQPAQLV